MGTPPLGTLGTPPAPLGTRAVLAMPLRTRDYGPGGGL